MKFLIRFNKTRGQPGRGTLDHAWRVFQMDQCPPKEYLAKEVVINVPSRTERSGAGGPDDFNIACEGRMEIDRPKSCIIINPES